MSDKTLREAAQWALAALEYHVEHTRSTVQAYSAIQALRIALAAPDEPASNIAACEVNRIESAQPLTDSNSTKCGCQTCRPITLTDMRMVLCATCGNKRCPHANDHRNACTDSNESGQAGSAYPGIQRAKK